MGVSHKQCNSEANGSCFDGVAAGGDRVRKEAKLKKHRDTWKQSEADEKCLHYRI